jgi:hypothetical protein
MSQWVGREMWLDGHDFQQEWREIGGVGGGPALGF